MICRAVSLLVLSTYLAILKRSCNSGAISALMVIYHVDVVVAKTMSFNCLSAIVQVSDYVPWPLRSMQTPGCLSLLLHVKSLYGCCTLVKCGDVLIGVKEWDHKGHQNQEFRIVFKILTNVM